MCPHDKIRIAEFEISYVGHPPVSIQYALCLSKGSQGSGPCRLSGSFSKSSKLHEDFSDEVFESSMTSEDNVWRMFFDGASRTGPKGKISAGVGVVFVSP